MKFEDSTDASFPFLQLGDALGYEPSCSSLSSTLRVSDALAHVLLREAQTERGEIKQASNFFERP